MKLIDAIEESIRKYYSGVLPEQAIEVSEREFIWTLEKFESIKTDKDIEETSDDT